MRVALGHVSVDNYATNDLVEAVVDKALHSHETSLVATVNAQLYVLSSGELRFQECLRRAEFVIADGISICKAGRWLSGTTFERIPGVDLIGKLCARGAANGLRVFFLGGHVGAGQDTADIMAQRCPGLKVVGVSCPDRGFEKNPGLLKTLLAEIAEAKPHIVFVGLGAPKQELFIDQHLRGLRVPVAIGVGGSFEMISGRLKRAPMWMQDKGLEWFHRLLQEPNRLFVRYSVGNAHFLLLVIVHYCRARFQSLDA